MGTGQSKDKAPDEQMRMKMENGFDESEDDIEEVLGLSDRDRNIRSKSNISYHNAERLQIPDGDEYFNQIYNKRAEKSLSSLNSSGSIGVKSAPPGTKKEKDPEVAAAIAELEETFKVLGDSAAPTTEQEALEETSANFNQLVNNLEEVENGISESLSLDDDPPSSPSHTNSTQGLCNSQESGIDSQSDSSACQLQYDRHLITRAGESSHDVDQNGGPRKQNKFLDLNSRAIGTSGGYSNVTYSSGGISRGSDQRGLLISSHASLKNARNSNNQSQSVLMQQRKDFQRQQAVDANQRNVSNKTNGESDEVVEQQENWTYEPPKIDGFDISKFKELNSKGTGATIVPLILRDDEDKGYYSRSPEIPAYTKDELELIASLEREVY